MKTRPLLDEIPDTIGRLKQQARDNELLLLRSNLLSSRDKALMQMVFDKGGTFEQIARLTGQSASTVSRRFHTVLNKLLTRELTALLRGRAEFDSLEIRIARAYYLEGLSQKAIIQKLGVSRYRVRNTLGTLRHVIYCNVVEKAAGEQKSA